MILPGANRTRVSVHTGSRCNFARPALREDGKAARAVLSSWRQLTRPTAMTVSLGNRPRHSLREGPRLRDPEAARPHQSIARTRATALDVEPRVPSPSAHSTTLQRCMKRALLSARHKCGMLSAQAKRPSGETHHGVERLDPLDNDTCL
jgi:hypothetical protein